MKTRRPSLFLPTRGPIELVRDPIVAPRRASRVQTEPLFGKVGHYRCFLADPPWNERGGGKIKRGAQRHYNLIKKTSDIIDVMKACPLLDLADDAHGYVWVTNNFLKAGIEVLEAMGFSYVSNVVWAKKQYGIGRYFRGKHEILLFGVRGNGFDPRVMSKRRDLPSCLVVDHPRKEKGTRIHSKKPDAFYELIEARTHGPRLEMFARSGREGWDSFGDQLAA